MEMCTSMFEKMCAPNPPKREERAQKAWSNQASLQAVIDSMTVRECCCITPSEPAHKYKSDSYEPPARTRGQTVSKNTSRKLNFPDTDLTGRTGNKDRRQSSHRSTNSKNESSSSVNDLSPHKLGSSRSSNGVHGSLSPRQLLSPRKSEVLLQERSLYKGKDHDSEKYSQLVLDAVAKHQVNYTKAYAFYKAKEDLMGSMPRLYQLKKLQDDVYHESRGTTGVNRVLVRHNQGMPNRLYPTNYHITEEERQSINLPALSLQHYDTMGYAADNSYKIQEKLDSCFDDVTECKHGRVT